MILPIASRTFRFCLLLLTNELVLFLLSLFHIPSRLFLPLLIKIVAHVIVLGRLPIEFNCYCRILIRRKVGLKKVETGHRGILCLTWPVVRHCSAVIEIALDGHLRGLELFISLAIIHIRYHLGQLEVLHVGIQV